MSVVAGKRIVLVGDFVPQLSSLKMALDTENAQTSSLLCDAALSQLHLVESSDLVVLNHQGAHPNCTAVLTHLQNSSKTKHMPVLTYVDNVEAKINNALMLGAADYFTASDDIDTVLQKVKSNFGMPNTYEGVSKVDLSERQDIKVNSNLKVYVVEDDPLLRALLSTKFDMSKVQYDFSTDGLSVEEKLRAFKPSVILLDIMIGAVNGLDVLESIKQTADLNSVPVVVFSNQDSDEERTRAARLGANEYLVKATTDLSDLVRVLSGLAKA